MILTWVGIVTVVSAIAIGIGSRFVLKKSDNIIEEIAEDIIDARTGVEVDLSPDTPDPS